MEHVEHNTYEGVLWSLSDEEERAWKEVKEVLRGGYNE